MKKLLFFISLLFILSFSSCDNSLSTEEELAFVQNLERRVQARRPFLNFKETVKKVVLSRTGEGAFEGYIDYSYQPTRGAAKNMSMKISVQLYANGDFSVMKR